MPDIKQSERAKSVIQAALNYCSSFRHEFFMPEHLLMALLDDMPFETAINEFYSPDLLGDQVEQQLRATEEVPEGVAYEPEPSILMNQLLSYAFNQVYSSSATQLDIPHLVNGLLNTEKSWACYLLTKALNGQTEEFMRAVIDCYEYDDFDDIDDEAATQTGGWRKLVSCMNELADKHNPLIGREKELERTIQVLCRCDKNNPLHLGEPGVGKTALVWGLVQRINEGKVPARLKDSKVYQLDLGTLLAGTQYRGDFENRLKQIMEGIKEESSANIVYIDEIHNLVGAGAVGESSMDASNLLKPYLEGGEIRFIGSTTYEEYNKHFSKSKGLVRRFQQIDILEPTTEEALHILQQLRPRYEAFHHVSYDDEALEYAVQASAKYVNDRFLPDKAIDLIDEAGASFEVKGEDEKKNVSKADIADVLAKTCKVEAMAMNNDNTEQLSTLQTQLSSEIYGQDEAIRQVTEAVLMAKAGLLEEGKPMASLLFVGPTGVGKTEVARVLARHLGIELVRFDMSEYTEKHAVAKLIGSPAGYVGYEDGGLLTDAIRRTPNCVLLLDEIEKAHEDIYNILLQVMDYARLTDNKGRKADFRNVVVIMTSNAGAQFANQASIGFGKGVSRGEAMLKQVKKIFKPEFVNRLSGTVVFHDMDRPMATLILKKKLGELQQKLTAKKVELTWSEEAFEQLLNEGFTREYGAREMDRVISQRVKPLLMREILFGSLKEGGKAELLFRGDVDGFQLAKIGA